MGANDIVGHSVAVAVVVIDPDNKFLLVKNYDRGWEFPGGFVEEDGLYIKDAAIREVKKETGIPIQVTNFLGIEQDVTVTNFVFLFKGEPVKGKLTVSDESEDIGYFTLEEAIEMMRLDHFKERMVHC